MIASVHLYNITWELLPDDFILDDEPALLISSFNLEIAKRENQVREHFIDFLANFYILEL